MPSTGKMYVLTYYDGNNNNANSNSDTAARTVMNSDVYQYTIQIDSIFTITLAPHKHAGTHVHTSIRCGDRHSCGKDRQFKKK